MSLRRTGSTSVGDVTGRDGCHRPRSFLAVGSHRLRFPAGVFVYFLRSNQLMYLQ